MLPRAACIIYLMSVVLHQTGSGPQNTMRRRNQQLRQAFGRRRKESSVTFVTSPVTSPVTPVSHLNDESTFTTSDVNTWSFDKTTSFNFESTTQTGQRFFDFGVPETTRIPPADFDKLMQRRNQILMRRAQHKLKRPTPPPRRRTVARTTVSTNSNTAGPPGVKPLHAWTSDQDREDFRTFMRARSLSWMKLRFVVSTPKST